MKRLASDDFMARLPSTVVGEGMLSEGNKYLFDLALRQLPAEGSLLEIGSFGGMSMNLVLHLMERHGVNRPVYSCDPWSYLGYHDRCPPFPDHIDGKPGVSRVEYMEYILESYKRALRLLHPSRLPFSIRTRSDEFFVQWRSRQTAVDVFGREAKLGGPLAFVYIDGDHSLEVSRRDLENAMEFLVPGGFLLFDDSAAGTSFGSAALMKEVLQRNDLEKVLANPNYLFRKRAT
jgi:Methyltransferase domain